MKFSVDCPACGKKISIVRIMMALTPFFFSCSKCHSKMRANNVFLPIFIAFNVVGITMILFLQSVYSTKKVIEVPEVLVLFLLLVFLEFVASLLVCNKAEIKITKDRFNKK